MLVEDGETLESSLPADTEEAGMDHDVFETIEARGSLGVSFEWEPEAPGEEQIVHGGDKLVDHVANFRRESLEWEGTVELVSRCSVFFKVLVKC